MAVLLGVLYMKNYLFVSLLVLSGCVATTSEPPPIYEPLPLTDQYIKDINHAALCSLSVTQGEPRIYAEISNRKLDCSRSPLVCANKGYKKGTKKFLECEENERLQIALKENSVTRPRQAYRAILAPRITTPPPKTSQQACGQIATWLERIECFEKSLSNDRQAKEATFGREVLAYMRVLIDNVKSGKMSESEAKYAYEQKLSEIRQRLVEREALENLSRSTNQAQRPPVFQPTPVYQGSIKTECRPARGLEGGFDCTTGPDAHDILLQRLSNPQ